MTANQVIEPETDRPVGPKMTFSCLQPFDTTHFTISRFAS